MSSSGNFERSENEPHVVAGEGTETAETDLPSTLRAEINSTRGRRDSEESDDQTAMDELQALFRRCHNSLPFVALFLIYFAYQHATGILVFVVGTAAVMGLDQRMRAQVALKDKASTWHLVSIVTMCAIDMVAICSVEGEPNPVYHFPQILQLKTDHGSDSTSELFSTGGIFWQVLWTVLVNDFLIRIWSVVVKALVAGAKSDRFQCKRKFRDELTTNADESPAVVIADEETDSTTMAAPLTQPAISTVAFYRRKRKLYGIIEMCSIFLRSLLASIPWCSFYQLCASKFMADVFTFAYLFIKFGIYVSPDELVEAGSPDCSICYESMKRPVKLACSHMFCEECVTEWFDHERSCPLCRANVESSGPTDAENAKPQYLDGRTSLVAIFLVTLSGPIVPYLTAYVVNGTEEDPTRIAKTRNLMSGIKYESSVFVFN
ncbi:hypothetical protein DD238_004772 [Peronospora effusa]|uniref:RING-type domain-containing protein n=1 Tax=Peronospora effusa TaxID=542832 RepID=A0A3M6VA73_9STRA|nr:hypothetical protein DD238_004772 [Peronospora effusa]